ncbi:hypothetical protein [Pseudomonas shahriarae]
MNNHTPGPWYVIQHGTMVVSNPNGDIDKTHIASIVGHNGDANFNAKGLEANANLIAAAPDLLAALEGFERIKDIWLPAEAEERHAEEMYALHMARNSMLAAIAKATQ